MCLPLFGLTVYPKIVSPYEGLNHVTPSIRVGPVVSALSFAIAQIALAIFLKRRFRATGRLSTKLLWLTLFVLTSNLLFLPLILAAAFVLPVYDLTSSL